MMMSRILPTARQTGGSSKRLLYYPVDPKVDQKALELCSHYLTNALRPGSPRHLDFLRQKNVLCDSGGMQAGIHLRAGKRPLVGPILKTITDEAKRLSIGILSNCKEYARVKSTFAFCIDFPTAADDDGSLYHWKLGKSIRARNQMLKIARYVCPETELAIALQPRTPLEVGEYFGRIATPAIKIYGFPIGKTDSLGGAYVLSFLHHARVPHIHFLGSSAPATIILLAQAIALNMFERASFDSFTWKWRMLRTGLRYLNPVTLQTLPRKNEPSLNPNSNLRWVLRRYPEFMTMFEKRYHPGEYMLTKDWLGLFNISAIEYFKDRTLDAAYKGDLPSYIAEFSPRNMKVMDALDLLHKSKEEGHEYVDGVYRAIIEQQS